MNGEGQEILTSIPGWPNAEVQRNGQAIKLPEILDKKLGGGTLLDSGIYPISFSSMVMGEATR